jgi:hypothetical protein
MANETIKQIYNNDQAHLLEKENDIVTDKVQLILEKPVLL